MVRDSVWTIEVDAIESFPLAVVLMHNFSCSNMVSMGVGVTQVYSFVLCLWQVDCCHFFVGDLHAICVFSCSHVCITNVVIMKLTVEDIFHDYYKL